MEIVIKDIPEEGLSLHFKTGSDGWFHKIVAKSLNEFFQKKDEGSVQFDLFRTGLNVDCQADLSVGYHPVCCRCLKVFKSHLDVPFHLTLAPLYESERQLKLETKSEVHLIKEDLDFSYYEGEIFNLGTMVGEQLLLALPTQPLCKPNCKGLCQKCGKDFNKETCNCKEEHVDHRWDALKTIKPKLKKA